MGGRLRLMWASVAVATMPSLFVRGLGVTPGDWAHPGPALHGEPAL
jgi:hypothetical protein